MTAEDLATLRRFAAESHHRVKSVTISSGRVVVKRQRPARSVWRERLLDLLARLVKLPMLGPVPAHGGARGQAIEVERLRALDAAGVRVPRLLHVEPAFFVMEHVAGPTLVERIAAGDAEASVLWRLGLDMLCDVHGRGQALSQAFARNVIVAADGLAMIDFEDDPLEAMSLDEAQARDWLLYLHSTAWHFPAALADALHADLGAALGGERDAVRALVESAGRRLSSLRHLPASRRFWGREVVGARALARLLHHGT